MSVGITNPTIALYFFLYPHLLSVEVLYCTVPVYTETTGGYYQRGRTDEKVVGHQLYIVVRAASPEGN